MIAKVVSHQHFAEACREFPEIERALVRAKAFLAGGKPEGLDSEEAVLVLDEMAIALGRLQSKFGW